MGKKSRKGVIKGKEDKKAHKQRQEERRERVIENIENDEDDNHEDLPASRQAILDRLYVGDRVWLYGNKVGPATDKDLLFTEMRVHVQRCMVTSEVNEEGKLSVLPVDADPSRQDNVAEVYLDRVGKDTLDWTLDFGKGDKVVFYNTADNQSNKAWMPATIVDTMLGFRNADGDLHNACFQVMLDDDLDDPYVIVMSDLAMLRHPSTFRFAEGDKIVFSTTKALGLKNVRRDLWIEGEVTRVDVTRRQDFYAVYECIFTERGKRNTCFISEDTDQHIISGIEISSPRQRLMDSIEQDCDYDHIDYLVKSSNMDVSSFVDLVQEKAILNASYDTLLWLQENVSCILAKIRDENGNGLLHQICSFPHAARFFKKAVQRQRSKNTNILSINLWPGTEDDLLDQTNDDGQSWLLKLILCENIRALEYAVSPGIGMGWIVAYLFQNSDDLVSKLKTAAATNGQFMAVNMLGELERFALIRGIIGIVGSLSNSDEFPAPKLFARFPKTDKTSIAKQVVRFPSEWEGHPAFTGSGRSMLSLERLVSYLAKAGCISGIRWLVEADASLKPIRSRSYGEHVDLGQFAQPELWEEEQKKGESEMLTLVQSAVQGSAMYSPSLTKSNAVSYAALLRQYRQYKEVSFLTFLSGRIFLFKHDYSLKSLLDFKIKLLQDGEGLAGRQQVVDYLVKEHAQDPPWALDAIRWRQCWVLRWLASEGILDLLGKACIEPYFVATAKQLVFLGNLQIPTSMSVGAFLCFAAVEFDDLQSLLWLLDDKEVAMKESRCHGWNLAHVCAYFGRSEIALSLRSREEWRALVGEKCGRNPAEMCFAVHIAIDKGFVFLADVFLSLGCPSVDSAGKDLDYYTKRSKHSFVRKWGKEKGEPLALAKALAKDLNKLYRLLSVEPVDLEQIRSHLVATKCMDCERWEDSSYELADTAGPRGKTYLDIIDDCCRNADPGFISWFVELLSPGGVGDETQQKQVRCNYFWKVEDPYHPRYKLKEASIQEIQTRFHDEALIRWLSLPWATHVTHLGCSDPDHQDEDPMMSKLLKDFSSNAAVVGALESRRAQFSRVYFLVHLRSTADSELTKLFLQGANPKVIVETIEVLREVSIELAALENKAFESYYKDWDIVSSLGSINLDCYMFGVDSKKSPLRNFMPLLLGEAGDPFPRLHVILAVEGYKDLIQLCRNRPSSLDADFEVAMTRIASYMGHSSTTEMFLRNGDSEEWQSSAADRLQAAILGAAEAGRIPELNDYMDNSADIELPADPIIVNFDKIPSGYQEGDREERSRALTSSVSSAAVSGYLREDYSTNYHTKDEASDRRHREVLKLLLSKADTTALSFLRAGKLLLSDLFKVSHFVRFLDFFSFLVDDLGLDVWEVEQDIQDISECFLLHGRFVDEKDFEFADQASSQWLDLVSGLGIDIQSLKVDKYSEKEKRIYDTLSKAQKQQLLSWSQFDSIKHGAPLQQVEQLVEDGRINLEARAKGSLLCTHVAAAYDRPDILRWLVQGKGLSLDTRDGLGRNVLQVSKASSAISALKWILEHQAKATISTFISTHIRSKVARRQRQRTHLAIVKLQAWLRGSAVRKASGGVLRFRLEGWQRFQAIWGRSIEMELKVSGGEKVSTWEGIKKLRHDYAQAGDDRGLLSATAQKLDEATTRALSESEKPEKPIIMAVAEGANTPTGVQATYTRGGDKDDEPLDFGDSITYTKEVAKWLRTGDSKYREFFIRRMQQLKAGNRSRILAKRLTGCSSVIFETYLEQKSGFRILWTKASDGSLLVWNVAKHKEVSRLARLIDDADSRSRRQLESVTSLLKMEAGGETKTPETDGKARVLLDPFGNTPLKLYKLGFDEIEELNREDWQPRLSLTKEEDDIVKTKGTVLVLGRSGTGKTVCICDRMEYDGQLYSSNPAFRQLFVTRSTRLCRYVEEAVGEREYCTFTTFQMLLQTLEGTLPRNEKALDISFLPSSKMDFGRFKREVHSAKSSEGLDALIIWTNIHTFIKGSIEALQHIDHVLPEAEYMGLGKKRCRLSPEHRKIVYKTFTRYTNLLNSDNQLWDDCDRISSLLQRLEYTKEVDHEKYSRVGYSKLYADEVQDYTQAEILLFFYLSGPGDLFLAGDPAQSVVEGVEFRFEDIRSVGYHISRPEDRQDVIPEKPKTVNVNFRSHSGILNTAAAVLKDMFQIFPDSAKQLQEDKGLFRGPRPAVFYKVESMRVRELIEQLDGVVILTHDDSASRWKRALGGYPFVYGIREAKGLEFQSMILVDFFKELRSDLQKPWREMLLGRDTSDFMTRYPEVEGQLKLLYTGVTRCINRLFFAETSNSVSGAAFVRWLTTRCLHGQSEALGIRSSVDNVEKMTLTPDEWCCRGLENAMMAETTEDLMNAESLLERALYCFQQIGDVALCSKARVHMPVFVFGLLWRMGNLLLMTLMSSR
jgi:hypothetical protein